MHLDCSFTDIQRHSNFLVALALGNSVHDFRLPGRQFANRDALREFGSHLRWNPGLALSHRVDTFDDLLSRGVFEKNSLRTCRAEPGKYPLHSGR